MPRVKGERKKKGYKKLNIFIGAKPFRQGLLSGLYLFEELDSGDGFYQKALRQFHFLLVFQFF